MSAYADWQEGDEAPWEVVNAGFDSAGQALAFARRPVGDSGLNLGFAGGTLDGTTVADGVVACTDDDDTYIVRHRTTLAISAATTTTNYANTAVYGRIGIATFAGGELTAYVDARLDPGGILDHSVAAAGDVVGPASATDNDLARFDGATGKLIKAGFSYDTDTTLAANSNTRVPTQAAVKAYADALVAGLSWKQAVRAATTVAVTLASDLENGDAIDGVTLATGDRILVKNQASATENGIYVVAASGAPTRSTDADTGAELVNASVYVSEGATLADTQWTCTTNATITIGATNIAFAQLTSGGSVATDAIWDAAGDLVQGTGANTAARLPIGTAHQIVRANSGATANAYANDTLTDSPVFSATPTLDTTGAEVIYFGALTANVTAFNLSGTRPKVIVVFTQDGTGGRTVTAGSSIEFGIEIADLSGIRSTLNTSTFVGFIYNPATSKFRVVAISK